MSAQLGGHEHDRRRRLLAIDGAAPDRVLDGPHVFLGAGAVGFMSAGNPQKLTFTNSSTDAVTVQVFVGRAA